MIAHLLLILALLIAPHSDKCIGQPQDASHGYCAYGYWMPGVVDWNTWHRVPPIHTVTRTLFYKPHVMDWVAENGHYTLDGVEGFVSLLCPCQVGWKVWIRLPGSDWIPVRVVDDVAESDMWYHAVWVHSGLELSYDLAVRLGVIDWKNPDGTLYPEMEICLTESDPVGVCSGTPAENYTRWFLSTATFQ